MRPRPAVLLFLLLTLGGESVESKRVNKTLNPRWDEQLSLPMQLTSGAVVVVRETASELQLWSSTDAGKAGINVTVHKADMTVDAHPAGPPSGGGGFAGLGVRGGQFSGVWLPLYEGYLFDFGTVTVRNGSAPVYSGWAFTSAAQDAVRVDFAGPAVTVGAFVGASASVNFSLGPPSAFATRLEPWNLTFPVVEVRVPLASRSEGLFGLGQRYVSANQRGRRIHSWAEDGSWQFLNLSQRLPKADASYVPVPFLLSNATRRGALLLNETAYAEWDLRGDDAFSVRVAGASARLTLFVGATPADNLALFAARRGPSLVPPPFTFAPWKQTGGVLPNATTEQVVQRMVAADVPFSLVQGYTHWFPGGAQRNQEQKLRAENEMLLSRYALRHTTYFNGYVSLTDWPEAYTNLSARGLFVKNASDLPYVFQYDGDPWIKTRRFEVSEVDFSSAAATAWYASVVKEAVELGFAGWMYDYGEYTPMDAVLADGQRGLTGHNAWIELYDKAVADALLELLPPREEGHAPDVVPFTRSGYTKSGLYSWAHWTGDASATFSTLSGLGAQVTAALTAGLAGFPVVGSDIGGYVCLLAEPTTEELLQRWVWFGAFSGIMRDETEGSACEGKRAQIFSSPATLDAWRRAAKLRTQLWPTVWKAATLGIKRGNTPLMQHHILTHPGDAVAHGARFQYMFADNLFLVAPAVEGGASTRTLYLPREEGEEEGERVEWLDVGNSLVFDAADGRYRVAAPRGNYSGGEWVTVPAPRTSVPLFVRAGSGLWALDPAVFSVNAVANATDVVTLLDRADIAHVWLWPRAADGTAVADDYTGATAALGGGGARLDVQDPQRRVVVVQVASAAVRPHSVADAASGDPVPQKSGWQEVADYARRGEGAAWAYDEEAQTLWLRTGKGGDKFKLFLA